MGDERRPVWGQCAHLRKAYAEAAPRLDALRHYERQKKQARQRALLELKHSTEAAYAKVRAANESRARKAQRHAVASEAQARTTLEHGGNPYVHARMRRAAEHREREEALCLARRRDAEMRIVSVLLHEEEHPPRLARHLTAQRPQDRYRLRGEADAVASTR